MGVKYDVIFKDGERLSREAVCFGSMASGRWDFGNLTLARRPASEQSMIQFYTANNLHPIWEEPDYMKMRREWSNNNRQAACRAAANRAFLKEMKLLLDDLPWLQDVLTIHPLVGVVRAHIKQHKADKIITSLMMVRNLGNYGEQASTYRHFRAAGLRPRLCVILAHMFNKNFGAMGRMDWQQQYLGEYNWINPQVFGKQAFMQMMSADKDTEFDFIQLPWAEQRGYRRDGFYRYHPETSYTQTDDPTVADHTPETGGWLPFDTRYVNAERWDFVNSRAVNERPVTRLHSPYTYTRNVVDAYSISGDEAFDSAIWNPVWGMSYFPETINSRPEVVNNLVEEMERICSEANIPSRFEV